MKNLCRTKRGHVCRSPARICAKHHNRAVSDAAWPEKRWRYHEMKKHAEYFRGEMLRYQALLATSEARVSEMRARLDHEHERYMEILREREAEALKPDTRH